jgi:hypothetical protein
MPGFPSESSSDLRCRYTFITVPRSFINTSLLFLLLLLTTVCLSAQDSNTQVATGVPPLSTTTGGPDSLNVGNLNANWSFILLERPGRGLPYHAGLAYDNSVWIPTGGSQRRILITILATC